ncbi:MAG: type I methionyl aminopeptidase [Bacteroidota bacterium]
MVHLKSRREIKLLREAADLVGRTLAEVGKHVQPGITTLELDRIAESYIRAHGARPLFKGHRAGKDVPPFPGSLCTSVNDAVVHGVPDGTVLQEGDLISIDCGVYLNGYVGDSAYSFAVGEISDAVRHLCYVTYESLYKGIEQSVHGKRVGDIGYAVQTYCEQHGYGVVRELCGHGVGKKLWEDPQVPNYGSRGSGKKLKAGMTICIEPMINIGTHEVYTDADDGWTILTDDASYSAHFEHMVAIRKGQAPDILSTFAYIEDVVEPPYRLREVAQAAG